KCPYSPNHFSSKYEVSVACHERFVCAVKRIECITKKARKCIVIESHKMFLHVFKYE
uniref:Uncharacterized protein n=1 Tax=Anopheles atroparvus TaxID=41427 RepID=A0AAG5DXN4_ANOAO